MNLKRFGWLVVLLGFLFAIGAASQLTIRSQNPKAEMDAIVESSKLGYDSAEYLSLQHRYAEAEKLGMWFGIASGITVFLGLALVFSAPKPKEPPADRIQ